jgi:hypothetical protein
VTPPLDARGRWDGFNLAYRLDDLGVIEIAREQGTQVRRKAAEIVDNRFAED